MRVWRLLKILQLVSGSKPLLSREIAKELGVHVRTFHRDRRHLEEAGLPIASDGQGYRLLVRPFLPAVHLTWDEGLALLCTVEGAVETGVIPYRESLENALDKIRSGIPPTVQRRISDAAKEIRVKQQPMVDMSTHQDTFEIIWKGIQERRVVKIEYMGLHDDEPVERPVEPLGIFHRWRAWYVVAHCRLRCEKRTFRVDRTSRVELAKDRFVPPRSFDLDSFLQDAWTVERGEVKQVRVQFEGRAARLVKELTWHPSQQIEEDPSGRITVSFATGGLSEVADWVMGYGGEARVLEPCELKDMIREHSQRILSVYENEESGRGP